MSMVKPLTEYERFILSSILYLTKSPTSDDCDPNTTDSKELAAARRIVAACQDAEIGGGYTLRQMWNAGMRALPGEVVGH